MFLNIDFSCLRIGSRDEGRSIAHHELEGGCPSCGMDTVVVCHLCVDKAVGPITGLVFDEDAQIQLQLLIDSFGGSVALGVICGGDGEGDAQQAS